MLNYFLTDSQSFLLFVYFFYFLFVWLCFSKGYLLYIHLIVDRNCYIVLGRPGTFSDTDCWYKRHLWLLGLVEFTILSWICKTRHAMLWQLVKTVVHIPSLTLKMLHAYRDSKDGDGGRECLTRSPQHQETHRWTERTRMQLFKKKIPYAIPLRSRIQDIKCR